MLLPGASDFATAVHLAKGDAQVVTALVGRLFSTHPGLAPPVDMLEPLFQAYNDVVEEWGDVADILIAIGNEDESTEREDWLVPGVTPADVGARTAHVSATVQEGAVQVEDAGDSDSGGDEERKGGA